MFSFELWLTGLRGRLTNINLGDWRHDWKTPANLVTFVRLLLTALPIWLLLAYPGRTVTQWWAVAAFLFVGLTDTVDGRLARARHEVTPLGTFMDPLVDKILVILTLVAICAMPNWSLWLRLGIIASTLIMAVREIHVTVRLRATKTPIAAIKSGKRKMLAQVIMIVVLMMPLTGNVWLIVQLYAIFTALLLTAYSWVDYYKRFIKNQRHELAA
jgi:CDP-diacylglycerol--glycerol-3-phosphate 3-phosphatidyltransferase